MTLKEFNHGAHHEAMSKFNALVEHKDGYFIVQDPEPNGWSYEIREDDVSTPEKLIEWIYHLTSKNWVTTDIIRRLIQLVSSHFGYKFIS